MRTHVMIDLETMGLGVRPAIVQIGAVAQHLANAEGPRKFRAKVDLSSSLMAGLRLDQSTVDWWRRQSAEARKAVFGGPSGGVSLEEALEAFDAWWGAVRVPDADVVIWSHGAATDVAWLANAYDAVGREAPWGHRAPRDTRTLYDAAQVVGWDVKANMARPAVAHDALEDAQAQLDTVLAALRHLEFVRDMTTPLVGLSGGEE